ncbi:hypothetical protein F5Y00DRAFT_102442 [Daldinia vernicosa]|uniref:uncharacterized protein n=1 Tax=Daldinia vernicosa TaxID=114800 RepID=UPI002008E512|nr:uncharacterized protein F5Y00DRAFT_102442 [Daldinia vernicosa]KAI0853492.1 hypothetical protein F5Y00DRAFT_102442 [Daldinia vernicosa]
MHVGPKVPKVLLTYTHFHVFFLARYLFPSSTSCIRVDLSTTLHLRYPYLLLFSIISCIYSCTHVRDYMYVGTVPVYLPICLRAYMPTYTYIHLHTPTCLFVLCYAPYLSS